MSKMFPLNAKVRFTQKRLSMLTPRDRQGLAGRIGFVQTERNVVRKPTVSFPADASNLELRLFRVDPSHLELVESLPNTEITSDHNDGENHSGCIDEMTAGADSTLSQSEMDNLFD